MGCGTEPLVSLIETTGHTGAMAPRPCRASNYKQAIAVGGWCQAVLLMASMGLAAPCPVLQVDAFSSVPFGGNPAAVCLLGREHLPLADSVRQDIAAEMNLAETAFVEPLVSTAPWRPGWKGE